MKDKDIIPPDVFLMMDIKEDSSACVLAEHYKVTIPAIMHKLDSLEKRGYVSRVVCENDRRKKSIILTEKAQELLVEVRSIIMSQLKEMFERLGDKDTNELLRIMNRIVEEV